MTRVAIAALAYLAGISASLAEDGFVEGVYLNSPEACALAREGGAASALEEGHLILTRDGITGYEYHCDFLELRKARRGMNWLATALCEEPGIAFPDLIAIAPRGEGQVELNPMSMRDSGEGGGETYFLCEGVEFR